MRKCRSEVRIISRDRNCRREGQTQSGAESADKELGETGGHTDEKEANG